MLDGAGNPRIIADVAIDKGRFVKIGKIAGRSLRDHLGAQFRVSLERQTPLGKF